MNLPLHTAIQEIAEECLLETPEGWLGGRFNDTWLPAPYSAALHYREALPFRLSPLSGAARPVRCATTQLIERPRAYVHLPTASKYINISQVVLSYLISETVHRYIKL